MKYSQTEMDSILAKLGEQGYHGLSKEEKQILFQKQLCDANSTRYDTRLELLLTIIVLFELSIHGFQRILLPSQLPIYMKLGTIGQNSTFNIIIGVFSILFFGVLFILTVKDSLTGKVHFVRQGSDKKSMLKYLGKISFLLILILWLTATIIS